MIKTPAGKIVISLDGEPLRYKAARLPRKDKMFRVDGRFEILIPCRGKTLIEIALEKPAQGLVSAPEPGEGFAMVSFWSDKHKTSIGVICPQSAERGEHIRESIRLRFPGGFKGEFLPCAVAWVALKDPMRQNVYTWVAADPTYSPNYKGKA